MQRSLNSSEIFLCVLKPGQRAARQPYLLSCFVTARRAAFQRRSYAVLGLVVVSLSGLSHPYLAAMVYPISVSGCSFWRSFFLFSLGKTVMLGDRVLFDFGLFANFKMLVSSFRALGRFFWPVCYLAGIIWSATLSV